MRRVVLVCGPPCAGKSTFVTDKARRSDLIVDYDSIAAELGSTGHEHDEHTRARVRALRAERELQISRLRTGTAYVVRTLADPDERAQVARKIGATEVVVLAPDRHEAIRRARADDRPPWTEHVVRRWYEQFRPSAVDSDSLPGTGTGRPDTGGIAGMADEDTEQTVTDETTELSEPVTGEDQESTDDESTPDGKDSAEYWKRLKRETDQRNKRLTRELENLRRQHMSEQERAVEEARDSGRTEALRELSSRMVDAELRSAAANRPINVDALLANVDRSKFLTDDGDVDRDSLNAWLDELAPVQSEPRTASDLGQGARGVNRSSPADVFGQLITKSLK